MKYSFIPIFIFLISCAQINDLTGGSDDDYAPTIDSAKSFPANGQVNFQGDRVVLKFNEYITLIKPNDNILITPRPSVAPVITAHNKKLEIIFGAPLQENTTYTINFNRAIADITEKNDSVFQYVFSTGDYIDSLELTGQMKEAFTNTGADSYLIALYPMNDTVQFDSIPYLTKPLYITQSDKNGNFKLGYLKYGLYYLFAFDDRNKNLILDPNEKLAFLPEKTILIKDQNHQVELKSFSQQNSECKIQKTTFSSPGKLEFIFTNPADSFKISTSCELYQEDTGEKDSMIFWLAEKPTARMSFAIQLNGIADTLKPLYKTAETLQKLTISSNVKEAKLLPDEHLKLTFSEPVLQSGISTENIHLMTTDSVSVNGVWEIENVRTLVLKIKTDKPMILQIDSAAVTSIYGTTNSSKFVLNFENHPESYYGSLVINTDSVFTFPAIIYLLDSKGNPVDTAAYTKQISFENIVPGDYQLRLVMDTDRNGEWTSGSLPLSSIPEKVIYFNGQITIKSKWIKELDWFLKGITN